MLTVPMKIENIEVKIYKPAKSAMQSGRAKNKWIIEPIFQENIHHLNKLMGWVSVSNTLTQLNFEFASKEDAINFAREKKLKYFVEESNKSSVKKKAYADNFTS